MPTPLRSRHVRLLLTLCLCIVFRGLARGQTLIAADVLPPEGVTFTQLAISDYIPWDTLSGTGVTWAYDWITVDSTNDISFTAIPLGEAPDAADYPAADRAVRSVAGTDDDYVIDRFYDLGPDRLSELGSVGPVLSYVYDISQAVYAFPMAVGDTVRGDYCFGSDGFGIQYHFCGESYITHDAEGTLVLPYGTFTGVKHTTLWASSFETTEPATDSSYSIRQQWFLPGVAFPVLDASIFIDSQGSLYPSARLMDQASITAVGEAAGKPAWSLFPVPASESVQLRGLPEEMHTIELLTAEGSLVRRSTTLAGTTTTLDLDGLCDGLYLVRAVGEKMTTTRRLVKAR